MNKKAEDYAIGSVLLYHNHKTVVKTDANRWDTFDHETAFWSGSWEDAIIDMGLGESLTVLWDNDKVEA